MKYGTSTIGLGSYTAADAGRILRVPYAKANYWFNYYAKQRFSSTAHYTYHVKRKGTAVVSFLTLIEMIVFYTLKARGIKTSRIVEAHIVMSAFLKTPHPFAMQNIYINEKSLLFGNEEQLLTADVRLQTVLIKVLKPLTNRIQFDNEKIACKFYPLGENKSVVVNPENQFGQPIIEGTNILTQTVYNLLRAGESKKSVARLFDLSTNQIEDVIDFTKAV